MSDNIKELEAKLRAAKEAEAAEKEVIKQQTPPRWQYTIVAESDDHDGFDTIYDDTIRKYKLSGEVVNEVEARAAGWSDHNFRKGAMQYLFNTGTSKLIGGFGGGTIYISPTVWKHGLDPKVKAAAAASAQRAMDRISQFLVENPEGGDITEIVMDHRRETKEV